MWPDGRPMARSLKTPVATKVMASLAEVATAEVKKTDIFTVPGLCRIKTRMKPATKADKHEVFGKVWLKVPRVSGRVL